LRNSASFGSVHLPTVGLLESKIYELLPSRRGKFDSQIETAPDGAVERFRNVGCCDNHSQWNSVIQFLQQRNDYAVEFANIVQSASTSAHRIKFVEKENAWVRFCKLENAPEVRTGLPKICADNAAKADRLDGKPEFCANGARGQRLAATWRPEKQRLCSACEALLCNQLTIVPLGDGLLKIVAGRRR
jgi:hypothetical protein